MPLEKNHKPKKYLPYLIAAFGITLAASLILSFILSSNSQTLKNKSKAEENSPSTAENVDMQNNEQDVSTPIEANDESLSTDIPMGGIPITSCMKITKPGNYYLQNDLYEDIDSCLDVQSNDVIVDGMGKNILVSPNQRYGIRIIDSNNIKISNFGYISGSEFGIWAFKSSNIVIENNNITYKPNISVNKSIIFAGDWKTNPFRNIYAGIGLFLVTESVIQNNKVHNHISGIIIYYSSKLTIGGNDVSNNFDDIKYFDYDICLGFTNKTDADKDSCRKCIATGSCGPFLGDVSAAGIWLEKTTDSLISNNIGHNLGTGIALYDKSDNNTIKNNDMSDNSAFGIHLYESSNNNIENNTVNNVSRYCPAMCNTSLGYDKCYKGCDASGILIEYGSNHNTIKGNTAQYSGDGFFQRSWSMACSNDNKILNNDFSFSQTNCIEASFCNGTQVIGNKLNSCGSNGKYAMGYGIWGGYSTNMMINDNEITNNLNGGGGIFIEHGNHNIIQNNRIKDNDTGMKLWANKDKSIMYFDPSWNENKYLAKPNFPSGSYLISGNTFSGNGVGVNIGSTKDLTIMNNTFNNTQNLRMESPSDAIGSIDNLSVSNNNLSCNPPCFSVINSQPKDLSLINNYWGTTDQNTIQSMIYDKTNDNSLGKVNYTPFRTNL